MHDAVFIIINPVLLQYEQMLPMISGSFYLFCCVKMLFSAYFKIIQCTRISLQSFNRINIWKA